MPKVYLPNTSSGQIEEYKETYVLKEIPETIGEAERMNLFFTQTNAIVEKQIDLEAAIKENRKLADETARDIKNQSNRNIEVVGFFSSVIALLILNINIVLSANTFLQAMILLVGITSTIAIFASLIHNYFNQDAKLDKKFWIPFIVISILLIISILAELFNWKILMNFKVVSGGTRIQG